MGERAEIFEGGQVVEVRLEERKCKTKGCENSFRVMPTSKQQTCSMWCTPSGSPPKSYSKNPVAIHGIGVPKRRGRRGGKPKITADVAANLRRIREESKSKIRSLYGRDPKDGAKPEHHKAKKLSRTPVSPEKKAKNFGITKEMIDEVDRRVEAARGNILPVPAVEPDPIELAKARYQHGVEKARAIVSSMNTSRMEIAAIAIEVCDIVHGGGAHWDAFKATYTLKKFSEDVGVHYKTLHTWVKIKKLVKDVVPTELWNDSDFAAAYRTANKITKKDKPDAVARRYRMELSRDKHRARVHTLLKDLRELWFFVDKRLDKFTIDECKEIHEVCSSICLKLQDEKGL